MLMMGVQVDGLRKHPNGRVDQLEDRYLGMVEAPSSNLGTSTRNVSKQSCWTVRHEKYASFCFFIGSARPPEMFQSSPVGPCASTNSIPNTFVDCSARPLSM